MKNGNGRNRRLSSQNRKRSGRKKAKTAGVRKRKGSGEIRGMDGPEKVGAKAKTRVNRKKHLQRLKPAEDERKLQTKLFVEQCVEAERRKPPLDESG